MDRLRQERDEAKRALGTCELQVRGNSLLSPGAGGGGTRQFLLRSPARRPSACSPSAGAWWRSCWR
jgi:hypothetical protein